MKKLFTLLLLFATFGLFAQPMLRNPMTTNMVAASGVVTITESGGVTTIGAAGVGIPGSITNFDTLSNNVQFIVLTVPTNTPTAPTWTTNAGASSVTLTLYWQTNAAGSNSIPTNVLWLSRFGLTNDIADLSATNPVVAAPQQAFLQPIYDLASNQGRNIGWDVKVAMNYPVFVWSHTHTFFSPGCGFGIVSNANVPGFINKHGVFNATNNSGIVMDADIAFVGEGSGGIWNQYGTNQQRRATVPGLVVGNFTVTIMMCGVSDFYMKGITILENTTFGVYERGYATNWEIDTVKTSSVYQASNQDGLHFDGPWDTVRVHGCSLSTGDDAVAFNSDENAGYVAPYGWGVNTYFYDNHIYNATNSTGWGFAAQFGYQGLSNLWVYNNTIRCINQAFRLGNYPCINDGGGTGAQLINAHFYNNTMGMDGVYNLPNGCFSLNQANAEMFSFLGISNLNGLWLEGNTSTTALLGGSVSTVLPSINFFSVTNTGPCVMSANTFNSTQSGSFTNVGLNWMPFFATNSVFGELTLNNNSFDSISTSNLLGYAICLENSTISNLTGSGNSAINTASNGLVDVIGTGGVVNSNISWIGGTNGATTLNVTPAVSFTMGEYLWSPTNAGLDDTMLNFPFSESYAAAPTPTRRWDTYGVWGPWWNFSPPLLLNGAAQNAFQVYFMSYCAGNAAINLGFNTVGLSEIFSNQSAINPCLLTINTNRFTNITSCIQMLHSNGWKVWAFTGIEYDGANCVDDGGDPDICLTGYSNPYQVLYSNAQFIASLGFDGIEFDAGDRGETNLVKGWNYTVAFAYYLRHFTETNASPFAIVSCGPTGGGGILPSYFPSEANYLNAIRPTYNNTLADGTGDWKTTYAYFLSAARMAPTVSPGHWLEQYALQVGNTDQSTEMQLAEVAMTCSEVITYGATVYSGLFFGTGPTDVRVFLTNSTFLMVSQDPTMLPCHQLPGLAFMSSVTNTNTVWEKPIGGVNNGAIAVLLVNSDPNQNNTFTFGLSNFDNIFSRTSVLYDAWAKTNLGVLSPGGGNTFSITVSPTNVFWFIISNGVNAVTLTGSDGSQSIVSENASGGSLGISILSQTGVKSSPIGITPSVFEATNEILADGFMHTPYITITPTVNEYGWIVNQTHAPYVAFGQFTAPDGQSMQIQWASGSAWSIVANGVNGSFVPLSGSTNEVTNTGSLTVNGALIVSGSNNLTQTLQNGSSVLTNLATFVAQPFNAASATNASGNPALFSANTMPNNAANLTNGGPALLAQNGAVNKNVLTYSSTASPPGWYPSNAAAGSGTVTSVAAAGDGTIFASSSYGTVTTSGTLTLPTPQNETANTILAGPTTGSAAAPTFRALAAADVPSTILPANLQVLNTNNAANLTNIPAGQLVGTVPNVSLPTVKLTSVYVAGTTISNSVASGSWVPLAGTPTGVLIGQNNTSNDYESVVSGYARTITAIDLDLVYPSVNAGTNIYVAIMTNAPGSYASACVIAEITNISGFTSGSETASFTTGLSISLPAGIMWYAQATNNSTGNLSGAYFSISIEGH